MKTPTDPGPPFLFVINSVTPSHTGMYTCVAKNVVGRYFFDDDDMMLMKTKTNPHWNVHVRCQRCLDFVSLIVAASEYEDDDKIQVSCCSILVGQHG